MDVITCPCPSKLDTSLANFHKRGPWFFTFCQLYPWELTSVKIEEKYNNFSCKKMNLKMLSAKWQPCCHGLIHCVKSLRPRQNGRHFADDTFKRIFLNENVLISIKISLKFVTKDPINNIPALVQIMAWRRPGDKPLSEPRMVSLPTHICVTRPQWVKSLKLSDW